MALHDRDSASRSPYPAATAIAVFLLVVGSLWWDSRDEDGAEEVSQPAKAPVKAAAPQRQGAPP